MNELKPEDVMRALECCLVSNTHQCEDCENCPFDECPNTICQNLLAYHALALLREYQAENAEKNKEIEMLMREKTALECVVTTARNQGRAEAVDEFVNEIVKNYAMSKIHYANDEEPTITYQFTNWQLEKTEEKLKGEKE